MPPNAAAAPDCKGKPSARDASACAACPPLLWSFAAEAFSPERSILAYEGRDYRAPDGPQENPSVQRSEEEAHVGVREREAGRVSARKSVHTEREVVRVPKRREEVDIERVLAVGEAREASGATEEDI